MGVQLAQELLSPRDAFGHSPVQFPGAYSVGWVSLRPLHSLLCRQRNKTPLAPTSFLSVPKTLKMVFLFSLFLPFLFFWFFWLSCQAHFRIYRQLRAFEKHAPFLGLPQALGAARR